MTTDKRQQLVDTALSLFYQHGVHALGINQVLKESGIAKKTLYHHFLGKNELIQACLVERDKRFMRWFKTECSELESLTCFIESFFNALDQWVNNRVPQLANFQGCFFVNVAAEFSDENSDIHQLCQQHKQHIKTYIFEQLTAFISDQNQKNTVVELLLLLKEGCINSAHVMGDKAAAVKAKRIAITYIQTSLPQNS